MKYIRTKEGHIIKWNENMTIDNDNVIIEKFVNQELYGFQEWCERPLGTVLKQADTIDELVDEAVFFDDNGKPHYMSQEGNIWFLGAALFKDSLRFGIFTETGLIYVAKMVDKDVVLI